MHFYGYHGALPEERAIGQRFVVDVELALDLRPAGTSDDLARTVNYAAVYEQVRAVVEGPPCALIEAVAERIAAAILGAHLAVQHVGVRVHKPEVPIPGILEGAEVEIVRRRE
jgi:dihydroneopterin aldolase